MIRIIEPTIRLLTLVLTLALCRIWLALIATVSGRIKVDLPHNGLYRIVDTWKGAEDSVKLLQRWPDDFGRGVKPVQCHSHNDYLHRVPLFEALLAGCTGVEADIWPAHDSQTSSDPLVGHALQSLRPDRTLTNLYINPLKMILERRNKYGATINESVGSSMPTESIGGYEGVFASSPDTTLVLLLDFKTADESLWAAVEGELRPLRQDGWLTHWRSDSGIVKRPLTVVGSGSAPFEQVIANSTYRDIFYDAPLDDLDTRFDASNSYYASVSFSKAIGKTYWGKLSNEQSTRVGDQVKLAAERGLRTRYWDTPSWPIGWRNRIWDALMRLGTGILNVDALPAAARWDWKMCVIGGINLCG
jgi:hypothetical protein